MLLNAGPIVRPWNSVAPGLLLLLGLLGVAWAQQEARTLTWSGPARGHFHDAGNWSQEGGDSSAAAPDAATVVVLSPAEDQPLTIDLERDAACAGIQQITGKSTLTLGRRRLQADGGPWLIGIAQDQRAQLVLEGGTVISGNGENPCNVSIAHAGGAGGQVVLRGAGTVWKHQGSDSVSYLRVGQEGRGSLQIIDGASLQMPHSATLSVAVTPQASGELIVRGKGSSLDVGNLRLGGSADEEGGRASAMFDQDVICRIHNQLRIGRQGTLQLHGASLLLLSIEPLVIQGQLLGSGRIAREQGNRFFEMSFDLDNQGALNPGDETGPLRIEGGDYRHRAAAILHVNLAHLGPKTPALLVLTGQRSSARFEGGKVEVELPENVRRDTPYSLVAAPRIELKRPPTLVLTGPGAANLQGTLSVGTAPAALAGSEALQLVLQ